MVDRAIIFQAMRRSGHHAIIDWIIDSYQGSVTFENNIRNHNPRLKRTSGDSGVPSLLIQSIEDDPFDASLDGVVVIARDPLNNIASRIRKQENLKMLSRTHKNLANFDCSIDDGIKRMKTHYDAIVNGAKFVLYPQWVEHRSYRKHVMDSVLGLAEHSVGYEEPRFSVAKYGDGSSYSGFNKFNEKNVSDVLRRYQHNASEVLEHIDDELIELARLVFGNEFIDGMLMDAMEYAKR